MRAQNLTVLAAGLLTITALSLAGCSTPEPTPTDGPSTPQSTPAASSAPASSSSTSASPSSETPSPSASADASSVAWAGGVQVVPSSGPVKLPAPKTQDAAMEVVFQMVQRYVADETRIEGSQSTDLSTVKPYVTGKLLAQLTSDVQFYKKIKTSGEPKVERILEPKDSWASTGEVRTKDGKKIRTKYSSVRLQYCVDSSAVKFKSLPKGTKLDPQKRRVFSADAFYYPTEQRWVLTAAAPIDGDGRC